MQGVKTSWVGRSFALAAPSDSRGHKKGGRRKTREERHTMIKSFVEKYKTSNKGDFPSISLTHKEVGGSYYTVREIMRELKQEHKSFDSLGTDLDVTEPERQVIRHSVQPLSISGEISMLISSSSSQVVESNHSLDPIEAKYQDILLDKEEQEIFIDNGLVESCGHNDQTLAKQEIQVVDSPLRTIDAPMLVGMENLPDVTKGQSLEKKEKNGSKSFMWDENPNNENTNDLAVVSHIQETGIAGNGSVMDSYRSQVENVCKHEVPKTREQEFKQFSGSKSSAVIVGNESVMESYISHVENVSEHEASEVWEQEFNAINDKTSSAVISLCEDASPTELQSSYDLGSDSFEKQNLPEPLEELEVAFPTVLENAPISVTKEMTACDSPLAENSSCLGYSEEYDTHSPLGTSQPVYSTSDSQSTTSLTELPVDLGNGANHDEENSLLSNSTNNMLEEPTTLADKTNSSMAEHMTAGETTEIQDGMMECQQLSSPNIDQEQMLTGVQVHTLDADQKVSSELQSKALSKFSSSNSSRDLSGKTASVPLSIVPQQGQGESIGNKKQSTQNNGDDANPISISENIDGASASTKSFEGPKKQENNIIFAILKTIAEGILYLFKE